MNKLKELIENGCQDFICKRNMLLIPDARNACGRTDDSEQECKKLWANLSYLDENPSVGRYIYGFPIRLHKSNDSISVRLLSTKSKDYSNMTKFRKQKGLTQEQLSLFSGVNIKTIQNYEQNEDIATTAQVDNLRAISRVLDCALDDLIATATNSWTLCELYHDDSMSFPLNILKNKTNYYRTIIIEGSIGSGKTTLAQTLTVNHLKDAKVIYDNNISIILNDGDSETQDSSLFITLTYDAGKRYIESISEVIKTKSNVLYSRDL